MSNGQPEFQFPAFNYLESRGEHSGYQRFGKKGEVPEL